MLEWMRSKTPSMHDSPILAREIAHQLDILRRNKISPIEDEFLFREFYPSISASHGFDNTMVMIVSENANLRGSFITTVCGESVGHRDELVWVSKGATDSESCGVGNTWSVNRSSNPVLDQLTFVSSPPSQVSEELATKSAMILLLFEVSESDISEAYRRAIVKMRHFHGRTALVFAGRASDPHKLSQLVWSVARCINSPELPNSYFLDCDKEGLFRDLLRLPLQNVVVRLSAQQREARLARAHAILISHIKSQLPTFNRQAKQDKLVDDLDNILKAVATKSGFPALDFPSADYLRERIRALDFSRVKKMKDSSLSLVSEFIERDCESIAALLPKASFSVARPPQLVEISVFHPPNPKEYIEDFQALQPENGFISGSTVRNHLLGTSQLPSQTLHRIWRLADRDKDGKLSLSEYAVCRGLIRFVQDGNDLPRNL